MSARLAWLAAHPADANATSGSAERWFRVAFVLFALGVAAGLLFAGFGPVPFIRVLGTAGALAGSLGMLVALAGCRHFRDTADAADATPVRTRATIAPAPAMAPLAGEADTSERLPVWPGLTQPA